MIVFLFGIYQANHLIEQAVIFNIAIASSYK
jgi:hypothetical protein